MGLPYPVRIAIVCLLVQLCAFPGRAQTLPRTKPDTIVVSIPSKNIDSLKTLPDTGYKISRRGLKNGLNNSGNNLKSIAKTPARLGTAVRNLVPDSPIIDLKNPFKGLLLSRPAIKFQQAFVSYDFSYRSSVDTPYVEKDLTQHNVYTKLDLVVAGRPRCCMRHTGILLSIASMTNTWRNVSMHDIARHLP